MNNIVNNAVYEIAHVSSGKAYIGSSVDVNRRIHQHRIQLRAGSHPNKPLQKDWNEFGEEAFSFDIVQRSIPEHELFVQEAHWITAHGNGLYNIQMIKVDKVRKKRDENYVGMVITIDLDTEIMEEIEVFQEDEGIKARTEAIRRLIWKGLDNEASKNTA